MPTTQITTTAFKTACAAIADALVASDFATANTQYGVAAAIYQGLLISQKAEDAGSMNEMAASLDSLRNALAMVRQSAGQDPNADVSVTSADFSDMRD